MTTHDLLKSQCVKLTTSLLEAAKIGDVERVVELTKLRNRIFDELMFTTPKKLDYSLN